MVTTCLDGADVRRCRGLDLDQVRIPTGCLGSFAHQADHPSDQVWIRQLQDQAVGDATGEGERHRTVAGADAIRLREMGCPPPVERRPPSLSVRMLAQQRKRNMGGGSLAKSWRLEPDPAVMALDQAAAGVEPETDAREAGRSHRV